MILKYQELVVIVSKASYNLLSKLIAELILNSHSNKVFISVVFKETENMSCARVRLFKFRASQKFGIYFSVDGMGDWNLEVS